MVQRKSPQKAVPRGEARRSHDSRIKGGGADDLERKMMKLERSIRAARAAADQRLRGSPMAPPEKPTPPNYMKPTTSSHARKGQPQLQVTQTLTLSLSLSPKTTGDRRSRRRTLNIPSNQSSNPPIKNPKGAVLDRATCSSTLKDSKFPRALDLDHGGTEAEGVSKIRVCPFTYCSLNGHAHRDPLPPLRNFISGRRKLIQTQKSMKLKGQPLFRVKSSDRGDREMDGEEAADDDLFAEIYTARPREEEIGDRLTIRGDDQEQGSEISNEEMDPVMSFLEYVEGGKEDHGESSGNELGKASQDTAESKASTFDFDWEEELKSVFPDSVTECSSECPVEGFDRNKLSIEQVDGETAQKVNQSSFDTGNDVVNQAPKVQQADISANVSPDIPGIICCDQDEISDASCLGSEGRVSGETEEGSDECGEKQNLLKGMVDGDIKEDETSNLSLVPEDEDGIQNQSEIQVDNSHNSDCETEESENEHDEELGIPKLKLRTRIRKKADDEEDHIREFNPRGPNFLDLDPDPEDEKVDLRHQTVDERKNSEEWMIDYALRRAVTKLAPERKKKVALIVEAIETVMPVPSQDKPARDAASPSDFVHGRIMQACS